VPARGDTELHRRRRQRDIAIAEQEFAAAQLPVQRDQRLLLRQRAVIDVDFGAHALGGDASSGRVQTQPPARAGRARVPAWRAELRWRGDRPKWAAAEIEPPATLGQQCLRPGDRHASEVQAREIGRGDVAVQRQVGLAVARVASVRAPARSSESRSGAPLPLRTVPSQRHPRRSGHATPHH
jgi:hypothetical protein